MTFLHIGIDDTDSPRKGCTTYIAALLVQKLQNHDASFIDYPNLIRLNPNIPWKTRGNGAISLRIKHNKKETDNIKETVIATVEENSDFTYAGTEPGIVFFYREKIPKELAQFSKKAIQGIVKMKEAEKLIKKFKAEAIGYKTARGIIGALAAIGETLRKDHTYELIAYRKPENRGKPRQIDPTSVYEMNQKTTPLTFNNIDPETKRILITPRGPDPILYGIRGETPEIVKKAHELIRPLEPIERWVIFRTNHGTDAHLHRARNISEIQPYHPIIVKGTVAQNPYTIPRRHVIFPIKDKTSQIYCAAYEPTGTLRKIAAKLQTGDIIEAYGGVRPSSHKHGITINLEKLQVIKLAPKITCRNPPCPKCGKTLKSMGKNKGFRCEKCGFRSAKLNKTCFQVERELKKGLYIVSTRSMRHLTKPFSRYGMEKTKETFGEKIMEKWHFP
ncbi:MAG: tRNA(Ile)(2)-agmatinylcytidine synthase [Candidatus Bathyarchaeia archaeon]